MSTFILQVHKYIDVFYNEPILNRKGMVWDDHNETVQPVTDYIAELILNDPTCKFDYSNILGICRSDNKPYNNNHDGILPKEQSKVQFKYKEIRKAVEIWKQGFINGIGKILDYQVPLKDREKDKSGKIDLLAYDEETNKLRILELKVRGNVSDSLLRTILEAETYKRVLTNKKRTKLNNNNNGIVKLKQEYQVPNNAEVVACPLLLVGPEKELKNIDKNSGFRAYEEFCNKKEYNNVHCFADFLKQEIIVIYELEQGHFAKYVL